MSARPCNVALCDCIGVDSPITGVSAEDADPVLFYARCGLFYDPYAPPTLGNGIQVRTDYSNVIFSGLTQEAADAQAAAVCSIVAPAYTVLASESVTATLPCTIGGITTDYSVTLPAGYITGVPGQSQEAVNAEALAAATEMLETQMAAAGCNVPPTPPGPTPPTNYLTDSDGNPILSSDGNYIEINV